MALDEDSRTLRPGACKRSPTRLVSHLPCFDGHVERFLDHHARFRDWTVERVAIAPRLDADQRRAVRDRGYRPQDLGDLAAGLLP